jgi:hypothetical protein
MLIPFQNSARGAGVDDDHDFVSCFFEFYSAGLAWLGTATEAPLETIGAFGKVRECNTLILLVPIRTTWAK